MQGISAFIDKRDCTYGRSLFSLLLDLNGTEGVYSQVKIPALAFR